MAEPVGAIASSVTLLVYAVKGTKHLYDLCSSYRNAFLEIERICQNLESLQRIFDDVQQSLNLPSEAPMSNNSLGAALDQCTRAVRDLRQLIERCLPKDALSSQSRVRARIRKLIKSSHLSASMGRLEDAKRLLMTAQSGTACLTSQATLREIRTNVQHVEDLRASVISSSISSGQTSIDLSEIKTYTREMRSVFWSEKSDEDSRKVSRLSPAFETAIRMAVMEGLQQQISCDPATKRRLHSVDIVGTRATQGSSRLQYSWREQHYSRDFRCWCGTLRIMKSSNGINEHTGLASKRDIERSLQSTRMEVFPTPWLFCTGAAFTLSEVFSGWNQPKRILEITPFPVVSRDSPIFRACRDHDLAQVHRLLDTRQGSIRDRDPQGSTLLDMVMDGIDPVSTTSNTQEEQAVYDAKSRREAVPEIIQFLVDHGCESVQLLIHRSREIICLSFAPTRAKLLVIGL
ncbi:MAG: hypothetical protein M1817_000463 [Caeruleum heppii]|nr:MAG: hypothetical protein M1817_000463 [Caeruleum heppii]